MIKIIPIILAVSVSSYQFDTASGEDTRAGITPIKSKSAVFSRTSALPSMTSVSFSYSRSKSSSSKSSSSKSSSAVSSSSSSSLSSSSSNESSSSSSSVSTSSSSSSSTSSSSSSSSPTPDEYGDYLFCDEYGPFTERDDPEIDVTFTYELHSINSQSIIERVRLFKNLKVVSAVSKGATSYTTGQRITTTFSVPILNYLASQGLQIRFEILNSSYSILKAYAVFFYPPNGETISGYSLKHDLYTSNSIGFYGDGSGLYELKDVFDFTNIGDYIDNDHYYRLDITRNRFSYWGSAFLSCKTANLRFNDDDYLFPNLHHETNGDIILPLTLNRNGSEISFKYKNQFYVNRKTLDSSDTYKTDYILTSDFYLPINGLHKFNGKAMYLDLNEIGLNKISTSIPLKYELNRTIVGVCADGDYCVVGGN